MRQVREIVDQGKGGQRFEDEINRELQEIDRATFTVVDIKFVARAQGEVSAFIIYDDNPLIESEE